MILDVEVPDPRTLPTMPPPPDPEVWVAPNGESIRLTQDLVLVQLEPMDQTTPSGIALIRDKKTAIKEPRIGKVLARGRGYWMGCKNCSVDVRFVPNTLEPGDRVLLPFLAGEDWSLDRMAPRQMKPGVQWEESYRDSGQSQLIGDLRLTTLRLVREGEILGVLEESDV